MPKNKKQQPYPTISTVQTTSSQDTPCIHSTTQDRIQQRQQHLRDVAAQLKKELFGIDNIIDRVIDSIRAWYVMPELISRPVIVCLWGLTGTGKTQLVRRLVQLLRFHDRFIEVQMDTTTRASDDNNNCTRISDLLIEHTMPEGEPGVLLLDEFQRYRTRSASGDDISVERYRDVWMLLSDGRLPIPVDFLSRLENYLADHLYERQTLDDTEIQRKREFKLSSWDARSLKTLLRLPTSVLDIMRWQPQKIQQLILDARDSDADSGVWQTNYSRLLIFITGNLDEMYHSLAERVQDCDTDADVFHAWTNRLSLIDVKEALTHRLRPEQIARLGNTHLIYPALPRAAWQQLIAHTCQQQVQQIAQQSGVHFTLTDAVHAAFYANTVFPAQGTRPMFSGLHNVLDPVLVNGALWVLQQQPAHTAASGDWHVEVDINSAHTEFALHHAGQVLHLPAQFDVQKVRQQNSGADFRTLLAVHEAGHGLLYGLLLGRAPQEIRINLASYEGGYNVYLPHKAHSRRIWRDMICVTLGGRAAELLVFGAEHATTGAEEDYKQATADAARYVRHLGFAERISRTDITVEVNENLNTDIAPSNAAIEALLQEQMQRAQQLLQQHSPLLRTLVQHLLEHGFMDQDTFARITGLPAPSEDRPLIEPYAQHWQRFIQQTEKGHHQ